MVKFLIRTIQAYQQVSKCCLPKTCRFYPSCSQYAIEALEEYGFLIGMWKALLRILRCSPLSSGGYDPVKVK